MLTLLGFFKAPKLVWLLVLILIAVSGYSLYLYERVKVKEIEGKLSDCTELVRMYKDRIEAAVSSCNKEKQILRAEFEKRLRMYEERLNRCRRLGDVLDEIEELK